jgi:hypothetical protein
MQCSAFQPRLSPLLSSRFLLLLVVFISGCLFPRKTNNNEMPTENRDLVQKLAAPQFDFEWLSLKGKVSFETASSSNSSTVNIRCRKDSAIWLSFTMLGIEGLRVMITPDSVKLINRLQQQYLDEPFSYINKLVPYAVEFSALQDLIAGNAIFFDADNAAVKNQPDGRALVTSSVQDVETEIELDKDRRISKMHFSNSGLKQEATAIFEDYERVEDQWFAFERTILVQAAENANLWLRIDKINLNEPLEFPFSISAKYERIR